ncbi:FaeA/PapI family transcriptional regulator, partial [Escherichia coli]
SLFPLKTREIADGCNMSVYAARYYLQELSKLYLVEPERSGRGKSIRWYLHK